MSTENNWNLRMEYRFTLSSDSQQEQSVFGKSGSLAHGNPDNKGDGVHVLLNGYHRPYGWDRVADFAGRLRQNRRAGWSVSEYIRRPSKHMPNRYAATDARFGLLIKPLADSHQTRVPPPLLQCSPDQRYQSAGTRLATQSNATKRRRDDVFRQVDCNFASMMRSA